MSTDKTTTTASATPDKVRNKAAMAASWDAIGTIPAENSIKTPHDNLTRGTLVQFDWSSTDPVDIENAKLIVASVNHAEKLAEALRDILSETDHIEHIRVQLNKAKQALAAYESDK